MQVKLMTHGWGDDDLPIDSDNKMLPSHINDVALRDIVFNARQPDALDDSNFNLFIWVGDSGWLVQSTDFDFVTFTPNPNQ